MNRKISPDRTKGSPAVTSPTAASRIGVHELRNLEGSFLVGSCDYQHFSLRRAPVEDWDNHFKAFPRYPRSDLN